MINEEKLDKILAAVEHMEKAGTIEKMFELAPEIPIEEQWKANELFISDENSFEKMRDSSNFELAKRVEAMEKEMAWAKFFANRCKDAYKNYKSREKEIKNPLILKFINDYENYYKGNENDKFNLTGKNP